MPRAPPSPHLAKNRCDTSGKRLRASGELLCFERAVTCLYAGINGELNAGSRGAEMTIAIIYYNEGGKYDL